MANLLKEMDLFEKYSALAGMGVNEEEPEAQDYEDSLNYDANSLDYKLNGTYKGALNVYKNKLKLMLDPNRRKEITGKPGVIGGNEYNILDAVKAPDGKNLSDKKKGEIEDALVHFLDIIYREQAQRGQLTGERMMPEKKGDKENSSMLANNLTLINGKPKYNIYIYRNPNYVKDDRKAVELNRYYEPKYVFHLSYILGDNSRIREIGDDAFVQYKYRSSDYLEGISIGPDPHIEKVSDDGVWAVNSNTNFYVLKMHGGIRKSSLQNAIEEANYDQLKKDLIYIMFSGKSLSTIAAAANNLREQRNPVLEGRYGPGGDGYAESPFVPDVNGSAIWYRRDDGNERMARDVQYGYEDAIRSAIAIILERQYNIDSEKISRMSDYIDGYINEDPMFRVKNTNSEYGSDKKYDVVWMMPTMGDDMEFWSVYPTDARVGRYFDGVSTYRVEDAGSLMSSSGKRIYLNTSNGDSRYSKYLADNLSHIIADNFSGAVENVKRLLVKNVKGFNWNDNDLENTAVLSLLINGISYNYSPLIKTGTGDSYKILFNLFGDCSKFYKYEDGKAVYYRSRAVDGDLYIGDSKVVDYDIDHINGMHYNNYKNLRPTSRSFNSDYWGKKRGKVFFRIALTGPSGKKAETIDWALEYDRALGLIVPAGYVGGKKMYTYDNGYTGKSGTFTITVSATSRNGSDEEKTEDSTYLSKTGTVLNKNLMEVVNSQTGQRTLFLSEYYLVGRFSKMNGELFTPITETDTMEIMARSSKIANFSRSVNNIGDEELNRYLDERYGSLFNRNNFVKAEFNPDDDRIVQSPYDTVQDAEDGINEAREEDGTGQDNGYTISTLLARIVNGADDYKGVDAYTAARLLRKILVDEIADDNVTARVGGKPNGVYVDIGVRNSSSGDVMTTMMKDPESWRCGYYFSVATDSETKRKPYRMFTSPKAKYGALCISVNGMLGYLTPDKGMKVEKASMYDTAYPSKSVRDVEYEVIADISGIEPIPARVEKVFEGCEGIRQDSNTKSLANHIFSASCWKSDEFKEKLPKLSGEKGHHLFVHHINGVQSDYRPDNLAWIDNTDNTRFDNASSIGIFRVTPGSGDEVPVAVWQTEKDFNIYSDSHREGNTSITYFVDRMLDGSEYELRWNRYEIKRALEASSRFKLVEGSSSFLYVFRRILLRDTDRVNIQQMFGDEKAIDECKKLVIGKEILVGDEKRFMNVDDPEYIWESDIMKCPTGEIMKYYMRGTISDDTFRENPELENVIRGAFESDASIARVLSADTLDEKISAMDGMCVHRMYRDHQYALWGDRILESPEEMETLLNRVSYGECSPDILPLDVLENYISGKKKFRTKKWSMDMDNQESVKYFNRILSGLRNNFFARKKYYYTGEKSLYEQSLERARKKMRGGKR